jgi:hypothetical protein
MNHPRRRCFGGGSGVRLPIGRGQARVWTRYCGFEASEPIPFPGADSIFSSRCGAISGRPRDRSGECRGEAPAARFFARFLRFQRLARRENFPLYFGDEFANCRRSSSAPHGFARKRLSDGTCGNARPWRFPVGAEGHSNNIPQFCFSEWKIRKPRRQPSRQDA